MLKTIIDYPKIEDEQLIVRANINNSFGDIKPVVTVKQIIKAQESVRKVYMDEKIEKYILDLVFATRYPEKYGLEDLKPLINFGASPRGSINLANAARCYAFIKRRGYVVPEDVRAVSSLSSSKTFTKGSLYLAVTFQSILLTSSPN